VGMTPPERSDIKGGVKDKVFRNTKRQCKAPNRTTNYAALVCKLLQRMSTSMRRDAISNRLSQSQRLALEAHMSSERKQTEASFAPLPALCDTVSEHQQTSRREAGRGIYKSAFHGKVYGYYAQAGVRNLMICTRIQRDLAATVKDHIILMKILERIRSASPEADLPGSVKEAVASVMREEALTEDLFLRGIRVSFSAQHWIGRNLYIYRDKLDSGLTAWARFESIKGPQLFKGPYPSEAYTPEKAQAQWKRARELFLELQADTGKLDRSYVMQYLSLLEAKRRDDVERTAVLWCRKQQQAKSQSANVQAKLSQRLEKLVERREEHS